MLSLLFYLISSLTCVLTANLIKNDKIKVVDIVHSNIPYIDIKYLSDFLVLSQTVFAVTAMDRETLSEMFLIMGITQLFRVLCSVSTILPPLKTYEDKYRLGGINGTGTEYIFSGHASYSALSTLYLYSKGVFNVSSLLIYNIISQFSIIITRNHYTVDIILAWIIVPLTWGNVVFCKESAECFQKIEYLLL